MSDDDAPGVFAPEDESGWQLVVPFLDGSDSFCRGFETGTVWALLQAGQDVIRKCVQCSNLRQLVLIASHYKQDMHVDSIEGDDDWCYVTFTPKAGPVRLTLIK